MYFIIVENVFNAEKLIHANIITHARKMTVIVLFRDCRDGKNARKKRSMAKSSSAIQRALTIYSIIAILPIEDIFAYSPNNFSH